MLKKKIIPVFLASVLTVSGTTGFVTEAFSENVYAAEEVHTERLADFADLLDDGQKEELEAKLDQVSEDYGCDVVVVTEETLDGAVPQDYADDFFDYNDYGMGAFQIFFQICLFLRCQRNFFFFFFGYFFRSGLRCC